MIDGAIAELRYRFEAKTDLDLDLSRAIYLLNHSRLEILALLLWLRVNPVGLYIKRSSFF